MDRRIIYIETGNPLFKWTEEKQKAFDEQQKHKQLCLARFCWVNANVLTPSGKTWAKVFEEKEGMTLTQFKLLKEQENGDR